jgi:hypothetical protein
MLPMTILGLTLEQWAAVVTFLAAVVTIFGFPLLLISLHFASRLDHRISEQLSELQRIAQSQNTIALNTMVFNDPINIRIMGAIEANEPILKDGAFLSVQLDKYLGDFETVATVYNEKLFTREQLDDHFSEFIEKLGQNCEVVEYLNLEMNRDYFGGLRSLIKLYVPTEENHKPLQTESTLDAAKEP